MSLTKHYLLLCSINMSQIVCFWQELIVCLLFTEDFVIRCNNTVLNNYLQFMGCQFCDILFVELPEIYLKTYQEEHFVFMFCNQWSILFARLFGNNIVLFSNLRILLLQHVEETMTHRCFEWKQRFVIYKQPGIESS